MFAPKGYTPVLELLPWFMSSISFWYTGEKIDEVGWEGVEQRSIHHTWSCIQQSPSILVARLDDSPIEVSSFAVAGRSWGDSRFNSHFNLLIGTLGSGDGTLDDTFHSREVFMSEETARLRYGPLACLPIILPTDHVRTYQNNFDNELRAEFGFAPKTANPEISYAEQIVSIYRSGSGRKRDDYKARVAPDMKHEEWRYHWREAVELIPELAKPGPKRTN